MHHELTKALYESYAPDEKSDFYPAYLYMKYIEHFLHHSYQASGLPGREPKEKLDENIDEMVKYYVQQIGEAAVSAETNTYHGKVVKLRDAVKLVRPKQDVNLSLPEKVIPYKLARDVVLSSNDSIAVGTCACRAVAERSCLPPPQEMCLFVGDPFASFIAAESSLFRKISQDQAVSVIEDAHERGFVHVAYFKKEMSNRFMAICNCCSCCCLGVRMWNLLEGTVPIMAPSGYVCEVSDECNSCGACLDGSCKFNAIGMNEEAGTAVIDSAKCMGCGICEDVCPVGAMSLRREPSKGEPLDLEEICGGTT